MNIGSAAGIGHRPNRQETVAAIRVGDGAAETLKIIVGRPAAAALDMVVAAVLIALPAPDNGFPVRSRMRPATRVRVPFAGSAWPATCTRSLSASAGKLCG